MAVSVPYRSTEPARPHRRRAPDSPFDLRAQRNQHNQASRAAARERAAKVFVERSVAAAPNPVSPQELAEMKKELEVAGADLVVPRATEEEGFQIAVEKA